MDKFGIFELLDTLSQITSDRAASEEAQAEPPASRPSPDDKSFLPPDLGGEQSGEQQIGRSALNSLYAKHESISKRIDKKQ